MGPAYIQYCILNIWLSRQSRQRVIRIQSVLFEDALRVNRMSWFENRCSLWLKFVSIDGKRKSLAYHIVLKDHYRSLISKIITVGGKPHICKRKLLGKCGLSGFFQWQNSLRLTPFCMHCFHNFLTHWLPTTR